MNALILVSALALGQPPASFHSPAPVAAKGDVKAGPPLVHTFELANATAGTVAITKVESACGCLRRALGAETLATGQKTQLTVEVNTLTQPEGQNRWQVAVGYTLTAPGGQPEAKELLLQINANLVREVAVSPPQLAFSTAGAADQTITITDKREKPLTVTKAATSSDFVTVEVAQAGGMPRAQGVVVKLSATAPAGHRDELVVLYTDDPAYPELRVPVRVLKRAAGTVIATPDAVSARFAPGQTEVSVLVQLRAPDGKAFAIAGAECDRPGVQVKHSTGSAALATVRVTVPQTVATDAGRCTLRVKLADGAGEVALPVSWTAAKK